MSLNSPSLNTKKIGDVARELGVSAHTLRYYEKIRLLSVAKDSSGQREYDADTIQRLKFIKRAQRMQFSLEEIKQLIALDESTAMPKPEMQSIVTDKLQQIDDNLRDLQLLKKDLSVLLNACQSSQKNEKCPILEEMKNHAKTD